MKFNAYIQLDHSLLRAFYSILNNTTASIIAKTSRSVQGKYCTIQKDPQMTYCFQHRRTPKLRLENVKVGGRIEA
jgi:hypothetical protein